MSWLRRFLGSAEREPTAPPRAAAEAPGGFSRADGKGAAAGGRRVRIESYGARIISIPELDMIGERANSKNGRFTLLWRDRHWADGHPIKGRYLLIDGDALVIDARMERPQHGKVADDGTFILNDSGDSQDLSGTFHAFRGDGSVILSRYYSANPLNNGLSDNARLAVCQTANSPGSPDSSVLSVFDLVAGAEIETWTAESGWASGYEFPAGGDRIRMMRRDRVSLDYSLSGEFIDRRVWLKDEVALGTLYVIRKALAEGEATTGLSLDALREGAKKAIADEDQRFVADAWRLLGEIEEAAGDPAAALAAYDHALAANPKVGVAKRAAALRKGLGA